MESIDSRSKITISNDHIICIITSSSMISIKKLIMIPDIQRTLSEDRVNEIMSREKEYYSQHKTFNFCFSPITLCQIKREYYVIDGMHRLEAMERLNKEYKQPFDVLLSIFKKGSIEEMNDAFIHINESLPVAIYSKRQDVHLMCNETFKYFMAHYGTKKCNFFSDSESPKKPNISKKKFQEDIANLSSEFRSSKDMIDFIESKNRKIGSMLSKFKLSNIQMDKLKLGEFHLGLVDDWTIY